MHKKKEKVQMVSLAVGDIHSEAGGGRGDEEDEGGQLQSVVGSDGGTVSQHYRTLLRCVCVAMRQKGGTVHSIVIDCPVSVCSPCPWSRLRVQSQRGDGTSVRSDFKRCVACGNADFFL